MSLSGRTSTSPSASTATPSFRPCAMRLMIEPARVSTMVARRASGNSSGIKVSVAPAALPMPSARCPALRPIAMTKYQRLVVFASTIRFFTTSTPMCRAVWKPKVKLSCGRSRSLSIVFGTCTTLRSPFEASQSLWAVKQVSSPPMVRSLPTSSAWSASSVFLRCAGSSGRIRARNAEVRAPAEMDAAGVGDGEGQGVGRVPFHQPAEAVVDAEDLDIREGGAESWRRRSRC